MIISYKMKKGDDMSFQPVKLHKFEDNVESRLTEDATYIVEFFDEKEREELWQKEYNESSEWWEKNEYTLLYVGFRNVLDHIDENLMEQGEG